MPLIFIIAWRNILRHRGRTLAIGVVLYIGGLLMTCGNAVVSGQAKGLKQNLTAYFTGDICIVSDRQESDDLFFDLSGRPIEPIRNYKQIRDALKKVSGIERVVPMGKNMALVLNDSGGAPDFVFLIGVDISQFNDRFPASVRVMQGRTLVPGESGMMYNAGLRESYQRWCGFWPVAQGCELDTAALPVALKQMRVKPPVAGSMVFIGIVTDAATDVRVPIRGIIKGRTLDPFYKLFTVVDIETYRRCMGYVESADSEGVLSAEMRMAFNASIGALDSSAGQIGIFEPLEEPHSAVPPTHFASTSVDTYNSTYDADNGMYNIITVTLAPGGNLGKSVRAINGLLAENGLHARAIPWRTAIGLLGNLSMIIRLVLIGFISLLLIVAAIVITNTLNISVLDRTAEIGTMRAVGGSQGFITAMIITETALLVILSGCLGVLTGVAAMSWLANMHIPVANEAMQLFYGADTFRPILTPVDIAFTFLQLLLVAIVSSIYPVALARKVTPLDAVTRE